MAVMSSPYKSAVDSPSRQLLWELSCLSIASQEECNARLDEDNREREAVHRRALAAAAEKHTRVREGAEIARRELELKIENERRRREDEERRELRKREQERAERELNEKRAETERLRQAQLQEQRREQIRKEEETTRLLREEKSRKAEAARRETERKQAEARKQAAEAQESERKAQEARSIKDHKQSMSTKGAGLDIGAAPPKQTSISISNPQCEAEHQRYLVIHKDLKELRRFVASESKNHVELKQGLGEMRRQIRKSLGQLTTEPGANKTPLRNIMDTFKRAIAISNTPQVDVSLFLAKQPSASPQATQISALLIYLLNLFAKNIIKQFITEAGADPKQADPIGTIASHIFALEQHTWNGTSLIDILITKLHVVCPILFGVRASKTNVDQEYNNRMTGLGAGFAALSLRNYEKSKLANPYPAFHYWRSFSYIVNIPESERCNTHCIVLKAMIETHEERFMTFFGDAALVALRYAILEFPKGVKEGMGQRALLGLADTMRRDRKIYL